MIKKFENFKNYNKIEKVIEDIEFVMLSFKDMGFEEIKNNTEFDSNFMYFYKKYIRSKKTNNLIQINGYIEDNDVKIITLDQNIDKYSEKDSEICEEFIDAMLTVSAHSGVSKIHFSFTNYQDEDKIIIYKPKKIKF